MNFPDAFPVKPAAAADTAAFPSSPLLHPSCRVFSLAKLSRRVRALAEGGRPAAARELAWAIIRVSVAPHLPDDEIKTSIFATDFTQVTFWVTANWKTEVSAPTIGPGLEEFA